MEREILVAELKGSLLSFCRYFYPLLFGRDFIIPSPPGREPHVITICRGLTKAARLELPNNRLWISVPPGHGKSTMLIMWTAWTLAQYPDSKYLYISYSVSLAAKHTETIKRVIQLPHYKYLFGVEIRHDARGKEFFQTKQGGAIAAFGSTGSIVGTDAGLPGLERFSGALILDDLHKIDEAHSETMRNSVITNYRETIQQRARGINVPIIGIGQRVHEDDVAAYLLNGNDGYNWEHIILKAIDEAGNPLYPEAFPLEMLLKKQKYDPYVFFSQFMQNPIPPGGALFKPEWFPVLDTEPKMLLTFITADTAETEKAYNDATVFSFWGMYEVEEFGQKTGQIALHWLNCWELRIEPKDLQAEFMSFYAECMLHPVKPLVAAIEKKSTGVTLASSLSEIRGLQIRDVKRTKASGSKTTRFLEMQPIIAAKLVSFTEGARHYEMCVNHMSKITANMSHKHDDLCHAAGSKIATLFGYKNIENIKIGDKVITPFGLGNVTQCGITGYEKIINKANLNSTPNHKIFTERGFIPLDTLNDDDKINLLSFSGLLIWRYKRLLCSMELNIDLWDRKSIILVSQQILKNEKIPKDCMWRFGNFIREGRCLRAISFITKTMTLLITTSITWSACVVSNTLKNMLKTDCSGIIAKRVKSILSLCKKKPKNGIRAKKVESGIVKMLKIPLKSAPQFVLFVIKNLNILNPEQMQKLAAQNAIQSNIKEILVALPQIAPFAEMNLPQKNNIHHQEIEKLAQKDASIPLKGNQISEATVPVYAITVEKYGVYYCNNVLVQNCDTLYDAIKMALIDKTLQINTKHDTTKAATILAKQKDLVRARSILYGSGNE